MASCLPVENLYIYIYIYYQLSMRRNTTAFKHFQPYVFYDILCVLGRANVLAMGQESRDDLDDEIRKIGLECSEDYE